jgi:DNA invertase Pin-like site-specific DNA recombinase
MKVALYARVSTDDKDQDPDTQLYAMRDYCSAQGYEIAGEYVDKARATDERGRVSWRGLMDDAAKRGKGFKAVVVFKIDRAFRSVRYMHRTLEAWEALGLGLISVREPQCNTESPHGRFMLNLLASLGELELETISERVKAGMDRARRQGRAIGRPSMRELIQWPLVDRVRAGGASWPVVAEAHPEVEINGKRIKVNEATFRNLDRQRQAAL